MGAAGLKVRVRKLELYSSLNASQIVVPRGPITAKGLLTAAIEDPNPVIFLEPKILYRSAVEQVPTASYSLPLSTAEVLMPGSDLTILTWGTPVYTAQSAIDLLSKPPPSLAPFVPESLRSATIELIDLQTILPWDVETVVKSVQKTRRLLILHEAGKIGGVGGEIASTITERCFLRLEAPVRRVTGWESVLSFHTLTLN
jgi:2-oxoisovalerate dehydrogenase E1 component beta subunit